MQKVLPFFLKYFQYNHLKFDEVYDFIKTSDALEKTKALAKSYTLSALNLIDKLPKGKNRELIAEITRKLLERTL